MAARAMWKADLKIGSTDVPVKLYAAVKDQTVRFHILDGRTMQRVKQRMVNPDTGKEVSSDEIQKGYEVEPGTFVILTESELEKLKPEPSAEIEILRFVPPEHVNPQWYDRPYYLGPDGDEKAYFALAEALANRNKEGIAKWVMRNKEYVGALRSQDGYLMLVTLRPAHEVISARDLPVPRGRALDRKEVGMAKQLVEMLKGEFNPADFRDEYRDRVTQFIEQKAKGKKPRLHAVKSKRAPASLANVLSKSIESLKEKAAA